MKKIFCYIVLVISLIGCGKSPGELTQERIENDLNENGIHGEMNIIDRKEDRNKIDVTVSIEDDLLKCESYMTYKAVDGEWVIDDFKVQFHDSRRQEHE